MKPVMNDGWLAYWLPKGQPLQLLQQLAGSLQLFEEDPTRKNNSNSNN